MWMMFGCFESEIRNVVEAKIFSGLLDELKIFSKKCFLLYFCFPKK